VAVEANYSDYGNHNPRVEGSSPSPATRSSVPFDFPDLADRCFDARDVSLIHPESSLINSRGEQCWSACVVAAKARRTNRGEDSDKTGERRWHTALTLLLAAGGFTALGLTGTAIVPTILMVTCCLMGAYAFKGPFSALSACWVSPGTLAAGLAGINAISNLIGGGLMVNVVGLVKQSTGSFVLGMLPVALLCAVFAICVLVLGRSAARAAEMVAAKS